MSGLNVLKLDSGRQEPAYAEFDFTFADVAGQSGNQLRAIWLPEGAVLHAARIVVETAFNSATSDTLALKFDDGTSILAATSIAATGRTAASEANLGLERTAQDYVNIVWTGVGAAPTAGKVRVFVSYTVEGKAHYNHGKDGVPPGLS